MSKIPSRPVRASWRGRFVATVGGKLIQSGDIVTDSRGDEFTFGGISRPPMPGKSAKVLANGREYYDRVFGIEVVEI